MAKISESLAGLSESMAELSQRAKEAEDRTAKARAAHSSQDRQPRSSSAAGLLIHP